MSEKNPIGPKTDGNITQTKQKERRIYETAKLLSSCGICRLVCFVIDILSYFETNVKHFVYFFQEKYSLIS